MAIGQPETVSDEKELSKLTNEGRNRLTAGQLAGPGKPPYSGIPFPVCISTETRVTSITRGLHLCCKTAIQMGPTQWTRRRVDTGVPPWVMLLGKRKGSIKPLEYFTRTVSAPGGEMN